MSGWRGRTAKVELATGLMLHRMVRPTDHREGIVSYVRVLILRVHTSYEYDRTVRRYITIIETR